MSTRITDSPFYQHLWGTAEARDVLGEEGRLQGWLEVIVALARAQAATGVIPAGAARLIAEHARPGLLDLEYAAEQTRQTSHSMLGLIRALQEVLPEEARQYVYVGATVQDITDTATAAGAAADRRHRMAGPEADRGAASRAGRGAPVHRDGGPHARPAGQPGHLRVEGGLLGRRGPPPPGPAPGGRPPVAGGAARRRSGQPGVLRGPRPGRPGQVLRRARAGRSRHLVADGPRPRRRIRPAPRADLRHPGADRRRGVRAAAAGDRRARRGVPGRDGRQHHHAAQAQPGIERASGHPWPGWPGRTPP